MNPASIAFESLASSDSVEKLVATVFGGKPNKSNVLDSTRGKTWTGFGGGPKKFIKLVYCEDLD